MKEKIRRVFKWIWKECRDKKTVALFGCVCAVIGAPVWVGYLLSVLFGWKWAALMASAFLVFWAGPFTPFFPICIGLTLWIRKLIERRNKKKDESPGDSKSKKEG